MGTASKSSSSTFGLVSTTGSGKTVGSVASGSAGSVGASIGAFVSVASSISPPSKPNSSRCTSSRNAGIRPRWAVVCFMSFVL